MYMIIADLIHISFLKAGYISPLKQTKTIVDVNAVSVKRAHILFVK